VSRPKYISDLHEAKYELRFCSGSEKVERLAAYRAAPVKAVRECGRTGPEVEAAVAGDFWKWVKDERLPKPSRTSK
jgi:hypothetical protein